MVEPGIELEEFDPLAEPSKGLEMEAMKQRIRNIIRSYHNATDVLAEPIQNAMDELTLAQKAGFSDADQLTIAIDVKKNEISIQDSGRGIPLAELKRFIAPDATDKRKSFQEGHTRGHKGVGLTFLAYGFNDFIVESKTDSGEHYRLRLEKGREWVEEDSLPNPPKARIQTTISDPQVQGTGTILELRTDHQTQPKELSLAFNTGRLTQVLLESLTAIGIVPPPLTTSVPIDAKLRFTGKTGQTEVIKLSTEYRFPHKDVPANFRTLDLGNYMTANSGRVEPKAQDKRAYHAVYRFLGPDDLKDYIATSEGEILSTVEQVEDFIDQHRVNVYGLFSYSTAYRDSLTDHWGIKGNKKFHFPGVRIATDQMISSWNREVMLKHAGGNKDRLWIVYHFYNVEPDMGRKDFPPDIHDLIRLTQEQIAADLIKKSLPFLRPSPKGGSRPASYQHPAVKAHQRKQDPIQPSYIQNYGEIPQIGTPAEEQDVIALFNQLLGLGILACYTPIYFSGFDDYDSYIQYNEKNVPSELMAALPGDSNLSEAQKAGVGEFKFRSSHLLDDIVNNTKQWTDMVWLICWEVDGNRAAGGDEIQFSKVETTTDRRYAGVTHLASLQSAGNQPIYVISLSDLIVKLEDSG